MKDKYPLLEEYNKTIRAKLELLKTLIANVQKEYTLTALEDLRKELHKIYNSSSLYGFIEVSELCQKLEIDIITKINNFNLVKPSSAWLHGLNEVPKKIEKAFSLNQRTEMQEKKKTIVVVDDDEDIVKLLTYEIHGIGLEVKSFKTGGEALSFLMEENNLKDISLVILDRMLPDMDGLEILREFTKKFPRKIPILILSVLGSEKDVVSGLQTGAVDYITKPFSVFKLMQKLVNMLGH